MILMVRFLFMFMVLDSLDDEFDGAVRFLGASDEMAFLSGFPHRFVDGVELEEFAVTRPNFLFDVTLIEVSGQAKGVVGLFLQGDVIRSFQLDHVVAGSGALVVAPSFAVLEQGQAEFLTS